MRFFDKFRRVFGQDGTKSKKWNRPCPGGIFVFPVGNGLSSCLAPGPVAGASLVDIAPAPGMLAACVPPLVLHERKGGAPLPDGSPEAFPGVLAFPVAAGTVSRLESAVG